MQDQNPCFIGPSSSLGKTGELQNKGRIKSVVSAVKVRKKQYGELLQEDVFGLGRETRAGMDGVIVNFPEYVNFRCKLKIEYNLKSYDGRFPKAKSDL